MTVKINGQTVTQIKQKAISEKPIECTSTNGGGCLVIPATYGSELAP